MTESTKKPAKKTMGPKRRNKKQYAMVSFELEAFEGEFTLPKLGQLPLGVATALQSGDGSKLMKFLAEYAPESVGAVEDLSDDEVEDFMKVWGKASGVNSGE